MYKLLDSVYTITFDASFTISRQSVKIIGYNTKYLTNSNILKILYYFNIIYAVKILVIYIIIKWVSNTIHYSILG